MDQQNYQTPTPVIANNLYSEICSQIIKDQAQIIGATLAYEQATQVPGLTVDPSSYTCTVVGDPTLIVNNLIEQYRDFFGHAAVEVCKEAASKFISQIPEEQKPNLLK